jgi:ankyrin repeat protein
MNIDGNKIAELAALAASLDPKKVAEANAKMEVELQEKLKNMSQDERLKLLAVQKVVTQRTVDTLNNIKENGAESVVAALQNANNSQLPPGALSGLLATRPGMMLAAERMAHENLDAQTMLDEKLLSALRSHDIDAFKTVLTEQKREPYTIVRFVSDPEGHPLIHWAALENNLSVIRYLFSLVDGIGAKKLADQRNVRGETALIWACMKGHTKAIHEIIKNGADVHAACSKGYSAMHVAAQNGHVFTMAQLARKGLQVDVRDNNGRTPLHWAAYKGFEHATRWLLSHGADPGAQDWEKCMPIHWASLRAHLMIVALLVEYGASGPYLKAKDKTGGTPITLAEEKVEKITRDLAENPNLDQPGRNAYTKQQFESVVKYCKKRQVVENLIEANGGKPTLGMRINAKMPHWSYLLWPILAPIGWWQYQTVLFPATSHHFILHLVFIVCFWAKWMFWLRLQIRDPGEYVVPHGPPGTTLGIGSLDGPSWGWRHGGFPDFTRRQASPSSSSTSLNAGEKGSKDDVSVQSPEETQTLMSKISDVRATKVNPNPAIRDWAAKHRALYDRVLDEGLAVPVCLSCEIVKPVRGKHDKISDCCVAKFDHFCPWMNSCVGELNYSDFFFTALSATIAMWTWIILVIYYTWEIDETKGWWANFANMWGWELFAWMYSIMAVYGLAMTAQHVHLAAKNMSTNEMISGYRYRYLVEDGTRGNPFDRGILMNYAELLGLVSPLRMDPEQYYVAEFAGEDVRPTPLPSLGSPWYRKGQVDGAMFGGGHSHAGGDDHGHSHADGNDHGHSHA